MPCHSTASDQKPEAWPLASARDRDRVAHILCPAPTGPQHTGAQSTQSFKLLHGRSVIVLKIVRYAGGPDRATVLPLFTLGWLWTYRLPRLSHRRNLALPWDVALASLGQSDAWHTGTPCSLAVEGTNDQPSRHALLSRKRFLPTVCADIDRRSLATSLVGLLFFLLLRYLLFAILFRLLLFTSPIHRLRRSTTDRQGLRFSRFQRTRMLIRLNPCLLKTI